MSDYKELRAEWMKDVLGPHVVANPPRPRCPNLAGGVDAEPLYGPDDLDAIDFDPVTDLGFPGQPPFTRGVQPNMHRGRLWTMRQYAGFGTAAESNERYRYLLAQGQTGLSVAFDLPTQMGRDSDDPRAQGEVGRVGVAIDSIEDMRTLLGGLPLDKISTSMTINSTAAILLCLYVAVAEETGVPRAKIRGTIQNDILKEYMARGTYIFPPRPSLRLITDVFAFCGKEVPKWNTISISGYHIREAGCDAVQEVAFTLADGIAYVQAAKDAGLDVDQFGAQLSFFFNVHNNLLEEVAKFRAARRMWCAIMKDRFHAKTDRARALRFHCQTAGMTLTAQQPLNNIVRVTVQTLAAVLGGCQSLHTNSFDEALGLPTTEAATIALRTQQIVGNESGVADFVDALGGSYAIEALTADREGGGALPRADRRARRNGRRHRAGVPAARDPEHGVRLPARDRAQEAARRGAERVRSGGAAGAGAEDQSEERTGAGRAAARDAREARRAGARRGARGDRAGREGGWRERDEQGRTLLPLVLSAVKAYATVGEISNVLRAVWGEHVETLVL